MLRLWKQDSGLTMLELMIGVVILGLIAVPLTNLGTTAFQSYKRSEMYDVAVTVAERILLQSKQQVEKGVELNSLFSQEVVNPSTKVPPINLLWNLIVSEYEDPSDSAEDSAGLKRLRVEVLGDDDFDMMTPKVKLLELSTIARVKGATP